MKFKLACPKHCSLRFQNCSLPEQVKHVTSGVPRKIVSRLLYIILKEVQLLDLFEFDDNTSFSMKVLLTLSS